MKKRSKRILLGLAMVLVTLAVLAGIAVHRALSIPAWYPNHPRTIQQQSQAAQQALQVLEETFSWSADMQALAIRSRSEGWNSSANTAKTITVSEDEINSYFAMPAPIDKATPKLAARVNAILSGFHVAFVDGAIVLSGMPRESHVLVSLVFKPRVDDQGHLDLQLTDVLAGTLAVPHALLGDTLDQLRQMATISAGQLRPEPEIDINGVANRAQAVSAYARILANCLSNQASDAILYVPFDLTNGSKTLAVRLIGISALDGKLTLTLRALTPAERLAVTETIRGAPAAK